MVLGAIVGGGGGGGAGLLVGAVTGPGAIATTAAGTLAGGVQGAAVGTTIGVGIGLLVVEGARGLATLASSRGGSGGGSGGSGGSGAACKPPKAPQGGTYTLRDRTTGEVVRTGRTRNLHVRERQHRRDSLLKDYEFRPDRTSNDPVALRGREQILYEQYPNAPHNHIRPISPRNPRRQEFLDAGRKL
jgi:hypothetical protein